MLLMPKRVKFRRDHRGRRGGLATRGTRLATGEFGLKAISNGWLTARQIEAARVAISRELRGGGKIWLRIFPSKPVTKKPAETRMGKGKGAPEFWVAVVQRGRVLFEVDGLPESAAREAMCLAGHKLPIKTRFISRHDAAGGA